MRFQTIHLEEIGSNPVLVQWRHFVLKTTMSRVGKALKKLTLVYKTASLDDFIDYMKPKLQHFVKHNFVAKWEDKHFKKCIKHFPTNIMVYVVDSAENYSFEVDNEVQSMHWHTYQVSILVHICFCHNLTPDPFDEKFQILIEYHFYIFYDRKHDYEFVQNCFKLHWEHMVQHDYAP